MGIGNRGIELLIKLRTAGLLRKRTSVMEIGAQQLSNSFLAERDRIAHLGHLFGIERQLSLPSPKSSRLGEGDSELLDPAAPFARDFWLWLGFDYGAIDIDGSPGSIPLDLNYDSVPPEAQGKYDFVTNFGTTEHVVNQLNAFKVIHDLTAPRGIMVHEVPAQGMFNHGLINYNFKFFWMLARSNGYSFIDADFTQSPIFYRLPRNIVDFLSSYDPSAPAKTSYFNTADAGILVVMEKSFDIPFVPPIDVQTGAGTEIEFLKKRYWTVFEPGVFERLKAEEGHPHPRDGGGKAT